MWIPLWIFCTTFCQPLEEVESKRFKTKEECMAYAKQSAQELASLPNAVQVGYKCVPEKDA